MRYAPRSAWSKAKIREVVRETVLAPGYTTSELDDIRLDVYFKLTGSRGWPDNYQPTNSQISSVLSEMATAGELVKTGGVSGDRGWRSRSAVHYRTPARQAAHTAELEARREARQQLQDEWLAVRVALGAKLNEDVRADKHGKPDLDLDTWQEVLRLMV